MRTEGLGPVAIARALCVREGQVAYVIEKRIKSDPEYARACAENPPRRGRGHKSPKTSERVRQTVREQLEKGYSLQSITQNTLTTPDYVERVRAARELGVSVEDVPTTWAGAFRRLAEFVEERDAEAYEFARTIAKAKGVTL